MKNSAKPSADQSLPAEPSQRTREQIVAALRQQPKAVATLAGDATVSESYAQAHSAAGIGDRPLIVLTRGRTPSPSGNPEIDKQVAAYEQAWRHEMQAQLVQLLYFFSPSWHYAKQPPP